MAKHETEMHRQRRIAVEALKAIRDVARFGNFGIIWRIAEDALRQIEPKCDQGLFAERNQLDLADRPDL